MRVTGNVRTRTISYIAIASAAALAVIALVALAQSHQAVSNTVMNSTATLNCTQYGEFQGEFQCGPQQVNATGYNATGGIPDEVEQELGVED